MPCGAGSGGHSSRLLSGVSVQGLHPGECWPWFCGCPEARHEPEAKSQNASASARALLSCSLSPVTHLLLSSNGVITSSSGSVKRGVLVGACVTLTYFPVVEQKLI